MRHTNRQWRLASYPQGIPTENNWTLEVGPIPEPGAGEMLVRAIYLDVAPYMRGRISPQKNYAAGISLGEVMVGGAIGAVVRSNDPSYEAGDIVVSDMAFGWQDFAVLAPAANPKVTPGAATEVTATRRRTSSNCQSEASRSMVSPPA